MDAMRRRSKTWGNVRLARKYKRVRSRGGITKCLLWHHVGPEGEFGCPISEHFVGDGGQVVDQSKFSLGVCPPLRLRIDPQFGEGELSSLAP